MFSILAQAPSGGFWMPPQASSIAAESDMMFDFIMWITVFFLIANTLALVIFVLKYRHRPGREHAESVPAHNTALELTWTITPTVIVLGIFYFGFRGYLHMSVVPPDAYEIQVTGRTWSWDFTYPNGYTSNELHVPINRPILLVLQSNDVIHSLFVPAFRVKKDAVPGRYNQMWFQATAVSPEGGFDVFCAEYCGQGHSVMHTHAFVHTVDDFKKWLEEASNWESRMSPVEAGKMFVTKTGCLQCHSEDGSAKTAPTFKELFGSQVPLTDGSTVLADENYIAESIFDPAAKVVRGYTVQMTTYRGRLKDHDVSAIIAYLKSISANSRGAAPATAPAP
jgi:cytochrome c oxidase subunit 2